MASYNEAIESRRTPDTGRFKSLVTLYKASATTRSLPIRRARIGRRGLIVSRIILASFALRNSTGRKKFGRSSAVGAINGPTSPAPPTMECKFCPACSPMRLIRSARSRAIRARASSSSTAATVPKSFGPTPTSQLKKTCSAGNRHAVDLAAHTGLRLRDLLRLSWSHVARMQSSSRPARAAGAAKRSFRFTMNCGMCWRDPEAFDNNPDQQRGDLGQPTASDRRSTRQK